MRGWRWGLGSAVAADTQCAFAHTVEAASLWDRYLFDFGDGVYSDGAAKRKVRICSIGGYCTTCHKTRVLHFFSSKVLLFANLLCTLCTIYMFLTKICAPKIFSGITLFTVFTPCKQYLSVK